MVEFTAANPQLVAGQVSSLLVQPWKPHRSFCRPAPGSSHVSEVIQRAAHRLSPGGLI
jgi:hypothetical protein